MLTRLPILSEDGTHAPVAGRSRHPGPLRRITPPVGRCTRVGCDAPHGFVCTGCRVMSYCSRACQTASWVEDGHAAVCGAWQARGTAHAVHAALTAMRISTGPQAALVRQYIPDPGEKDPLDALYAGRAIAILAMEPAEVEALMAHRKRVVHALADRYYEELTKYDNHGLDYRAMKEWVKDLEAFAQSWDDIWAQSEAVPSIVLEKTWPGFDEDETDLEEMQEGLMDASTIAAAHFFTQTATYVSSEEFLGTTIKVFREIIAHARYEGRRIVWVNYATMNRSSSWMTLIMAHLLDDAVDDVVASYSELHALAASDRLGDKYAKIAAIIPDDAAYTGKQLALKIRKYGDRLGGFAATAKIEHYIAVPYMTERALRETGASLVSGHGMLRVLAVGPPTIMRSFDEISSERDGARVNVGTAHFIHRLYPGQVPVYFAHKLPDRISVPNNLFASAPYMVYDAAREAVHIKTRSFITGCEDAAYAWAENPKAADADDHAVDYVQTPGNVCPFPVYKGVEFALDSGGVVAPDENMVLWADAHPNA